MSERDDGGPAFPVECSADHIDNGHQTGNRLFQQYGMTLRDYFAAKAMHAAMTSEAAMQVFGAGSELDNGKRAAQWSAEAAYLIADAMLKARQQ